MGAKPKLFVVLVYRGHGSPEILGAYTSENLAIDAGCLFWASRAHRIAFSVDMVLVAKKPVSGQTRRLVEPWPLTGQAPSWIHVRTRELGEQGAVWGK